MTAATFFKFLRPVTLAAPCAGVVGGAVAASAATGLPLPAWRLLAAVSSALLLTGASNGINQIADIECDRINRPDRPLPSGAMTHRQALALVVGLASGAIALAALVNVYYFACVVLTLPVTTLYSVPPLRLKRVPFVANASIATPRGLLLVVAGWAVGGGFELRAAWVLGLVAWLYVFGAATTKDFADTEGDRATGCKTLPVIWGSRRAAWFVAPFLVLPFLLYPVAAHMTWLEGGLGPWLGLGTALAAVGVVAGALLVRNPAPRKDGRNHPAWGLMYLQLIAAHLGAAAIYVLAV